MTAPDELGGLARTESSTPPEPAVAPGFAVSPSEPPAPTAVVRTVRDELARLIRQPRLDLTTVAVNAVMVTVLWLVVPQGLRDWFFDNLHGRIAFAVVLGTWMLSDTTSTNLLGNDPATAQAVLRGELAVERVLVVKSLVLGLLVGAVSIVVAVVMSGGSQGRAWAYMPSLVTVPVAVVAMASLVGVVAPFRVRTLTWRWRHRRELRQGLRWAILVAIPYLGVGPLAAGLLQTSRWVAARLTGFTGQGRPPLGTVAAMSEVSLVVALATVVVCPLLARGWIARHGDRVRAALEDDERA